MDQPPPLANPAPPPVPDGSPEPSMSLIGRLFNVFATPGEVFEEVRTSPVRFSNWVVPMVIFMIVGCIGSVLIFSQAPIKQKMREQYLQTIQPQVDSGKIPKDRVDTLIDTMMAFGTVGAAVSPVVYAAIQPFWWGLIIWLVGARLWKANFDFMKAVEVAGLAITILILQSIIHTLMAIITSNVYATANLILLVKDPDPKNPFFVPLTALDATSIWALVVRSIALARLGGRSFARAAVWVFGVWIVTTGFFTALAALGQLVSKAAAK